METCVFSVSTSTLRAHASGAPFGRDCHNFECVGLNRLQLQQVQTCEDAMT